VQKAIAIGEDAGDQEARQHLEEIDADPTRVQQLPNEVPGAVGRHDDREMQRKNQQNGDAPQTLVRKNVGGRAGSVAGDYFNVNPLPPVWIDKKAAGS